MGKSTGEKTKWKEEELDMIEMYATIPSISDMCQMMGKDYVVIKKRINDAKKKLNTRGVGGNGLVVVGVENAQITNQNLIDMEKSNKRAAMVSKLIAGQEIIVRDEGQRMPQKVKILENNGNFITCMQANKRILTLNRGSIISRRTLIGVLTNY